MSLAALVCWLLLAAPSTPDSPEKKSDSTTPKTPKVKTDPVEEAPSLDGYYTCKGKEAGGKSYTGICVIAKKNDVYLVSWMIGAGSSFTGIGIRQGNNLAVSWSITGDRGVVRGVNLYQIQSGGRLSGRWATLPGPGVMQTETLTFLKGLDQEEE
jgi:hypothetical protein